MERVGFIGFGNMGTALAKGAIRSGFLNPEQIYASNRNQETLKESSDELKINMSDNITVARECDIIILGVKPYLVTAIIDQIKDEMKPNQLFVCMAAGINIEKMESQFNRPGVKIIRILPNMPALVGAGMTAISINDNVSKKETDFIVEFCNSFGIADVIPESLMDVASAVGASSPAFSYMFMESLADGAVLKGLDRKRAYKYAAQAVLGAAKMVLESGEHPGQLKDRVCSPGGTTIEGVLVLEEQGMRSAVINAMDKTTTKASKLG